MFDACPILGRHGIAMPAVQLNPVSSTAQARVTPARVVVGLTGLAGSGKSVIAGYLVERHGFVRGKFAGALKVMLRAFLRYRGANESLIERMIEGDLKELPTPLLNDRSPRHAMLTLGTAYGRDLIDPDIWVDTEMDARINDPRVVFDDVRFPNEHAAILKAGGFIVNVTRPGQEIVVAPNSHESESYSFEADVHLINDGSISDLFRRVDYRIIRREAVPQKAAA